MPKSMSAQSGGPPVVGSTVPRSRILSVLERLLPCTVFCIAPAGYGKTHLAAQIASMECHQEVFWVDCQGEEMTPEALLERTLQSLLMANDKTRQHADASHAEWSVADVMAQVDTLLRDYSQSFRVCLVLDDVRIEAAGSALERLIDLTESFRQSITVVVTSREVPEEFLAQSRDFVSLGTADLMLSRSEGETLLSLVSGGSGDPGVVGSLLSSSGGQAALFSVLARHYSISDNVAPESLSRAHDMRALLLSLARSQLSGLEMELLFLVAILGKVSRSELISLSEAARDVSVEELAMCIPLLRREGGSHPSADTISAHAIAQGVYGTREFVESFSGNFPSLFRTSVAILERRGDYGRALRVLALHADQEYLASWLETNGPLVTEQGLGALLRDVLESLHPSLLLKRPRLLLQIAGLLADQGEGRDAAAKAAVARDLAMCEGDYVTVADVLIKLAEIQLDLGELDHACASLNQLLALPHGSVADAQRLVTMSYLCAFLSVFLEHEQVAALETTLRDSIDRVAMTTYQEARIRAQLAVAGAMFGRFAEGVEDLHLARRHGSLPVALQVMIDGNLASFSMEVGKIGLASEACESVLNQTEDTSLKIYNACFSSAMGTIRFSQGEEQAGIALSEEALRIVQETEDPVSEAFSRTYLATALRASGEIDRSMTEVERVLEIAKSSRLTYFEYLAEVELAAGFLALGDHAAAERYSARVREVCMDKNAEYHVVRADMVLAEVARREGRSKEALSRLIDHEEYILSENPNWSIAMYIRAFPHLLGMLASALGPDRLPTHMLRMITGHHIDESLSAARKILEEPDWQVLAYRMLGEEGEERIAALSATAPCRVRLFGGLEVSVGTRQVLERDWRKRKARLLFAMLVLQQGREVPRDRVYDHLWPEMDASRSRNNFYVIWSSMKGALVPESGKGEPCPYVEHTGGVCKVVPEHVFSDVAEFDMLISNARQAEVDGDRDAAVRGYERVADLYRGDLLPGDVYDDWFASARNHYRQEFCDGMLAAHRLMTDMGDHPGALRMIRRGIGADPWREDLYQAAIRSHIASGQRSAAIDTYLSCRSHLAEQLGLDPSSETMRLYEQILAMEEGPGAASSTE